MRAAATGHESELPVRLTIATTLEPGHVDSGQSASKVGKKYHVRPDMVNQVAEFDGDRFVTEFNKATV